MSRARWAGGVLAGLVVAALSALALEPDRGTEPETSSAEAPSTLAPAQTDAAPDDLGPSVDALPPTEAKTPAGPSRAPQAPKAEASGLDAAEAALAALDGAALETTALARASRADTATDLLGAVLLNLSRLSPSAQERVLLDMARAQERAWRTAPTRLERVQRRYIAEGARAALLNSTAMRLLRDPTADGEDRFVVAASAAEAGQLEGWNDPQAHAFATWMGERFGDQAKTDPALAEETLRVLFCLPDDVRQPIVLELLAAAKVELTAETLRVVASDPNATLNAVMAR